MPLASQPQLQARLQDVLKKSRRSLTEPRRQIFSELAKGPITPAELGERLEDEIDRATVYRTVELYERLGLVNRIWREHQSYVELSEVFQPHHHHAVCQRCGATIDFTSPELEALLTQLAKKDNFLAVEHSVELTGYCARCHS